MTKNVARKPELNQFDRDSIKVNHESCHIGRVGYYFAKLGA